MTEKVSFEWLSTRSAVRDKTLQLIKETKLHIYAMSVHLSFLQDPDIVKALLQLQTEAEDGPITALALTPRNPKAERFAPLIEEQIKAKIRFYPFGQTRIIMVDGHKVLLAFPDAPDIGGCKDATDFGLYIEDSRLAQWQEKRFQNRWDKGWDPKLNWLERVILYVRQNKEAVLVSAAIALASFLAGAAV